MWSILIEKKKMSYMATPLHKNPCPRGHEIYNFGRPFLGHHYYILGLSDQCLGVEKKIFYENTAILHFYPKITSPFVGGNEINNFLSPYPTDATYKIWLRLAQ